MPEGALVPVDIFPMAQGYLPGLPPGALVPGSGMPPWRDMLNLRPHEGLLRLREPVRTSGLGTPPYSLNNAATFALPLWVGEIPLPVGALTSLTPRYLVITTLDWFMGVNGVWSNVTPQHTVGTVTVAGTAVTGAGTAWLQRGIKPGDIFEPNASGNWFVVDSVNSDNSITLESSAGAFGAGTAYRIRRTMRDFALIASRAGVFVRVLNGDVYVCGMFAGGRTFVTTTNIIDGAVLKIAGGASNTSSLDGTDVSFLTAGSRSVESGVDNVGFNFEPIGFDVLEDGRFVVLCNHLDFATLVNGGNRLLYSSHLNEAVWTSSPAGFTDIVQRRGHATAMGRIGRSLTIHFIDGIRLGEPTGQDDPPLAFPQTSAAYGAIGPRVVRQTSHGEVFVAPDGSLNLFDGARATPIAEAQFWHFLQAYRKQDLHAAFAAVDDHRGEYSLFIADTDTDSFRTRTYELRYSFKDGHLTKHSYPFRVHAVAEQMLSSGVENHGLRRSERQRLFGVASFGNSLASDLVYFSTDDSGDTQGDSVPNVDGLTAERPYVETDDLDFGDPQGKKALERVQVWVRSGEQSGTETLSCAAYAEGTSTAVNASDVSVALVTTKELLYTFFFTPASARLWRVRIWPATDDTNFIGRMVRMRILAAPAGDVRGAP